MRFRRHGRQYRQWLRRGECRLPHQSSTSRLIIDTAPSSSRADQALRGAAAAYGAVLVSLPLWNATGLTAVGAALAAFAVWACARREWPAAFWLAWPPLHFAVLLTGGAHSPLLPLMSVHVAALLRPRNTTAATSALAALLVVLASFHFHGAPAFGWMDALPSAAVWLAGAVLAYVPLPATRSATAALHADPQPEQPGPPDAGSLPSTEACLELMRQATDAHEAALWEAVAGAPTIELADWAAVAGTPRPPAHVDLEGHPFGWAVHEQVHVHLQRGRRDLPSPWAQEMLLVPLPGPPRVLTLAYPGGAPPGAESVALEAARHLAAWLALLAEGAAAVQDRARTEAVLEAVRTLPGEIDLHAFAQHLAAIVCTGTRADGAAVALAPADGAPGRILHVELRRGTPPELPAALGDGDSRTALAMKHGVMLRLGDLRAERERSALIAAGERWRTEPRSAVAVPLQTDHTTLGAVTVWHADPHHFTHAEVELLQLVCSLAHPPMHSASRYADLHRRASTDTLTGLPNRRTFEGQLAVAGSAFDRYARPFSVAILDVDHFKRFNDTWGHEAGDHVLQQVGEVLRSTVRDVDLPARLGGEEFVVLLPESTLHAAREAAERIRLAIERRTIMWNGQTLRVTASFGVASSPQCTTIPSELLALADAALYRAKEAGRNGVAAAPVAAAAAAGAYRR